MELFSSVLTAAVLHRRHNPEAEKRGGLFLTRLFKNKIFIGAICLLLAGVLAFVLLPRLYSAQASTVEIVTLKQDVAGGTVISDDMLTTAEVGSYGLPDNVVKDKSEIAGLVAKETIYAGEYLWRNRFMTEEAYQKTLPESGTALKDGSYLLTIGLPSASSGLAGILRGGDVVDVYGSVSDNGLSSVGEALTAVPVYTVLNSKLVPLDDLDLKLKAAHDADQSDYDFIPAYVVFIVNDQQAQTLIGLEKDKSLHLVLRKAGA
jgi:pilus assembly protein CpaB